jgi:hypothetical protein
VARLRAVVDTSSLVRAALNADSAAGQLIGKLSSAESDSQIDLLILDPWRDIRNVKLEAALAMYEESQPANRNRGAQP